MWRWAAGAYGLVAAGMAAGSLALVAMQVFVVHHLCSLCALSAIVSWLVAALAVPEAVAGWRRPTRAARHIEPTPARVRITRADRAVGAESNHR